MKTKLIALVAGLVTAASIGGALPASADDTLMAGVASADMTPENGRNFFGYVRPDIAADGVALRLFGHALVLKRGDDKLAIVSVDYGTASDKGSLVARVADRGFTHGNVLFSATHTHAGPDVAIGYDDFALEQLARAIREADDAAVPARAGWGTDDTSAASRNRSIEAHLANHGLDLIKGQGHPELDPDGVDHTINERLSLLRVEGLDGEPIAAWANFAMHPTTFIPANSLYSGDYPGVAARRFAEGFDDDRVPVTLFAMGSHGDQAAIFDEYNQHAVADRTGQRIAKAMKDAWKDADDHLSTEVVLGDRWLDFCFCGGDAAPGQPTSPIGFWGASFFGGSEDGASIFYEAVQTEGRRRPAELADPVHGRKILATPAPFSPSAEVHIVRVGDRLLMGIPGEPTVEMGRRFREAVLGAAPDGVADALPVGLSSQYTGYFTTPEEYDMQHYEGGHTIFGRWTSNLLMNGLVELAAAFGGPSAGAPNGSGSTAPGSPWTGGGGSGDMTMQPADVERLQVIEFSWTGGENGIDRPLDAPFFTLERADDEDWEVVDSDLGYRAVWWQEDDEYRARYDVPEDFEPGTYRFRITSSGYEHITDSFTISAHDDLMVRGVEASELFNTWTRLVFRTQNPAPDPERNLLARDIDPNVKGESFDFVLNGETYTAHGWNGGVFIAAVPGTVTSGEVTIAAGAVEDKHGNTSGEALALEIGQVRPVEWPPPIGPGGGRTPGVGGEGHFPP